MPTVPHEVPVVSPLLAAGLILAALPHLAGVHLSAPSATEVIDACGVSRSQAYALRARIWAVIPECQRPPGRPADAPAPPTPPELRGQVLQFVYAHPGCVHGGPERRRYSDAFRLFVLDRAAEHVGLSLPSLAEGICIPEETLRDWLRGDRPHVHPPPTAAVDRSPTIPQVETVLNAWDSWQGGFLTFCEHVQIELRIPFSRALLSEILEANGSRVPRRRRGRSPDESGLRGQFETFFAGAQWVGDGKTVVAEVDGERVACNLELHVDAHTGAFVGLVVTPTEDAAAVVQAFEDAVATTGEAPLALLLDNKPSNHAPEVDQALGETARIRATPFRPPNKAHVEGAFGLFAQTIPDIVLATEDPVALVRQVVLLVATTWARATNRRPRADRGKQSRFGLYGADPPSEADVTRAREALQERRRRQELARQTLAARQDPVVRDVIADAFTRFGLVDPEGHLLNAVARYSLDHVLAGIATYTAKFGARTLPPGADARYLLGIVRNIAHEDEGWQMARELWRARLLERDRALQRLQDDADRLAEDQDPEPLVKSYVDRALATSRRGDRLFWLTAVADVLNAEPEPHLAEPLFRLAARRISATHAVDQRERLAAIRFLAANVVQIP
jgi:hypothetical protein